MGQPLRAIFEPGRFGYHDGPAGTYEAQSRLHRMDADGIDISVLFPPSPDSSGSPALPMSRSRQPTAAPATTGFLIVVPLTPPDSYRFLTSFCWIGTAIKEVKRAAQPGHKGVFVCAAPANKQAFWDKAYDLLWAKWSMICPSDSTPLGMKTFSPSVDCPGKHRIHGCAGCKNHRRRRA